MDFLQIELILLVFIIFFVIYVFLKINNGKKFETNTQDMECPCCGGKEFSIGKQMGFASIYSVKYPLTKGSHVIHIIGQSCGCIVESYVEKPESFK